MCFSDGRHMQAGNAHLIRHDANIHSNKIHRAAGWTQHNTTQHHTAGHSRFHFNISVQHTGAGAPTLLVSCAAQLHAHRHIQLVVRTDSSTTPTPRATYPLIREPEQVSTRKYKVSVLPYRPDAAGTQVVELVPTLLKPSFLSHFPSNNILVRTAHRQLHRADFHLLIATKATHEPTF